MTEAKFRYLLKSFEESKKYICRDYSSVAMESKSKSNDKC